MKHYYIKTLNTSLKRGYNTTVTVYEIVKNDLCYIGESHHNTASWKGNTGCACTILNKARGHKTNGYTLISKNITLHYLP